MHVGIVAVGAGLATCCPRVLLKLPLGAVRAGAAPNARSEASRFAVDAVDAPRAMLVLNPAVVSAGSADAELSLL